MVNSTQILITEEWSLKQAFTCLDRYPVYDEIQTAERPELALHVNDYGRESPSVPPEIGDRIKDRCRLQSHKGSRKTVPSRILTPEQL